MIESDSNYVKESLVSFFIGVVLIALLWIVIAEAVEKSKVRNGYLTYRNHTYTITLYDTLDKPEKDKDNETDQRDSR